VVDVRPAAEGLNVTLHVALPGTTELVPGAKVVLQPTCPKLPLLGDELKVSFPVGVGPPKVSLRTAIHLVSLLTATVEGEQLTLIEVGSTAVMADEPPVLAACVLSP
jgi:hypothetical protein